MYNLLQQSYAYCIYLVALLHTKLSIILCGKLNCAAVAPLSTLLSLVSLTADHTLITDNILEVVKGIEKQWEELSKKLIKHCGGQSKRDEIRQLHHSNHHRMEALINFYIKYHPTPSWQHIASSLQKMGLHDLADSVSAKYIRGKYHAYGCENKSYTSIFSFLINIKNFSGSVLQVTPLCLMGLQFLL